MKRLLLIGITLLLVGCTYSDPRTDGAINFAFAVCKEAKLPSCAALHEKYLPEDVLAEDLHKIEHSVPPIFSLPYVMCFTNKGNHGKCEMNGMDFCDCRKLSPQEENDLQMKILEFQIH